MAVTWRGVVRANDSFVSLGSVLVGSTTALSNLPSCHYVRSITFGIIVTTLLSRTLCVSFSDSVSPSDPASSLRSGFKRFLYEQSVPGLSEKNNDGSEGRMSGPRLEMLA